MCLLNVTDDYDKMTLTNFADNEDEIDIIITTLLLTNPCSLSILCLMILMV